MRTVVMDGDARLNITQGVDVQIIEADASGAVIVTEDGDSTVMIPADAELELQAELDGEFGVFTELQQGDIPWYSGTTEVTPSLETQVLETASKAVSSNIVINPIPSNYGLITWNGATLTVS